MRRGKKRFFSSSAGAHSQHQNQLLNPGVSKSSCPTCQETQRIFIWYLPCVPRAFPGISLRKNQLYSHSPEQAVKFPAPSLVSRVNADYPGSYHLHNPDREELQLFQTMWLIPTEANPPRPSNLWESDCLMLSSSCRSMGMASSWQSPCTCACKKTGSSDKAFPQAAKPARPRRLRLLRELRGWKEDAGRKEDAAPASPIGAGGRRDPRQHGGAGDAAGTWVTGVNWCTQTR